MSSILCLTKLVFPKSRVPIANRKEYFLIISLALCHCSSVHSAVPSTNLVNSYNFSNCSPSKRVLSILGFSSMVLRRLGASTVLLHASPLTELLRPSFPTTEALFIGIFTSVSVLLGGVCTFASSGANI